jgi:methionyl aminopeptidase
MRPTSLVVLKSAGEIARMRRAGRLAAEALREVARAVAPGVTTAHLDRLAETVIRDRGGTPSFKGYRGYPASICTSIDDEVVHGIPGPRVLDEGELLSIDLGVRLGGFHVDVAVSVPVGEIPPEAQRLIATTVAALDAGVAAARAGGMLGDLSWAIQSVVEAAGFSAVRDFAGHGVGRALHEDPQVPNVGRPGTGAVLQVGMTLAVEPMVNMGGSDVVMDDDGWTVRTADHSLSAHAEHTIAITEHGPEILTRLGMVVTSRAGRDAGDRYVVIGAAGPDAVLVSDGRRRGTGRPKRKNVKHLVVHGPAGGLAGRLRAGLAATDEELREALNATTEGE